MENTKKCRVCGQEKPVDRFNPKTHQCSTCRSARNRRNRDSRALLLDSAKDRAKQYGWVCTITKEDIVIPETCPVLGIPLYKTPGRVTANTPTLDRIVCEHGYVPGNVGVISFFANATKSNLTLAQAEAMLAYIRASGK